MLERLSAAKRHKADLGWLQSAPVFAFGSYQDEAREGFGPIRVCNDDRLAPDTGFGAHPHSDMEIVSIILDGSIRHEDNLGNRAVSGFGGIQRMSAGTGIIHTEFNDSTTEPLRLLQLWFMPERRGMPPSYEATVYEPGQMVNRLLPVVSGRSLPGTALLHQDVTIYLCRLEPGQSVQHNTSADRKLLVYAIDGQMQLCPEASSALTLDALDVVLVDEEQRLGLNAATTTEAFFMLIDMCG